jgi:hypothetical protein
MPEVQGLLGGGALHGMPVYLGPLGDKPY